MGRPSGSPDERGDHNGTDLSERSDVTTQSQSQSRSSYGQSFSPGHRTTSRRSTQNVDVPLSKTNIYIRGLPPSCTAEDLHDLCEQYGVIVSTKAVVDQDTQRCRGYGFVDFESPDAAHRALHALNNDGVHHAQIAKEVKTRNYEKAAQHLEQDPTNLYIANLPKHFDENSIRELLSPHGLVISTRVLRNPDGQSRCVGFARMESKEACDSIIAIYNGRVIDESTEPLVVKLADSGSRRAKHSTSSSGGQSLADSGLGQWQGQPGPFSMSAPFAGEQSPLGLSPPYPPFLANNVECPPNSAPLAFSPCYQIYDPVTGAYSQLPQGQFPLVYTPMYSQAGQMPQTPPTRPPAAPNPSLVYHPNYPYAQQFGVSMPPELGPPPQMTTGPTYYNTYVVDGSGQQISFGYGHPQRLEDTDSPQLEQEMAKLKVTGPGKS